MRLRAHLLDEPASRVFLWSCRISLTVLGYLRWWTGAFQYRYHALWVARKRHRDRWASSCTPRRATESFPATASRNAVLGMRSSAPGLDGLSYSAWKSSLAVCREALYECYTDSMMNARLPGDFN